MTMSTSFKTLAITSAFATLSGLAMFAQSGAASAKSVLSCTGADRQSVIDCCENKVSRKGMPMWMRESGLNCSSATMCGGGKKKSGQQSFTAAVAVVKPRLCSIRYTWNDNGGDNVPKSHDKSKRGDNSGKK